MIRLLIVAVTILAGCESMPAKHPWPTTLPSIDDRGVISDRLAIKGIPLGSSPGTFPALLKLEPRLAKDADASPILNGCGKALDPDVTLCSVSSPVYFEHFSHLGNSLPQHYRFSYLDGQLHGIEIVTKPLSFSELRNAFIVKYGQPSSRQTETFQTENGRIVEGERLTWTHKSDSMELIEYWGRLDLSAVRLYTPRFIAWRHEVEQKATKARAKEL